MEIQTHRGIDLKLCGEPTLLKAGHSVVTLKTSQRMTADDQGLVHGGFIFGLADFAAMVAVNHPNVVLGGATVTFLKPVKIGETVTAEAIVSVVQGKKHVVTVKVTREKLTVFEGEFACFVLDHHVLDSKI